MTLETLLGYNTYINNLFLELDCYNTYINNHISFELLCLYFRIGVGQPLYIPKKI